jgi:hypothetical protein
MRRVLEDRYHKRYELVHLRQAPNGSFVQFAGAPYVRQFLQQFAGDCLAMPVIRAFLAQECLTPCYGRTEQEVLGSLERHLVHGFARVVALDPKPRLIGQVEPTKVEAKRPRAAEKPAERADSWIELKIVDDVSSDPYAGVVLRVRTADRSISSPTTWGDGCVRLDQIVAGPCTISCPAGEGTVQDTVAFVGVGESPTGKKEASDQVQTPGREKPDVEVEGAETNAEQARGSPIPRRALRIADITEHRVKSGDTLEQLADTVGLSAQELARFNWGVDDPESIQDCLGAFVGCTRRDEQGNYLLDDSDSPGIIYLPQPWELEGLGTEQTHTIRVKLVPTWVRMLFQLDVDEPEAKDDTIIIRTDDGGWTHEIPVSNLKEVEPDWVELLFPRPPPGRRYSMIQDLGEQGDAIVIFDGRDEGIFWAADPELVELYKPEEDEDQDEEEDHEPEPDPDEDWEDDDLGDEDLEEDD